MIPWVIRTGPCFITNCRIPADRQESPNDPPDKPSLISPANGTADLSLTPLLKTGTFVDPDSSDYHQYTRWQISTQSDFSTTVFHYTSASHLTSISITDLTLVEGQTYLLAGTIL